MHCIDIEKGKITLEISSRELKGLCNALKEVCNQIEEWEFETRMSIPLSEAKSMLETLTAIYQKSQEKN